MRGRHHFRMVRLAEIIVRTEINDRMRFAVIIQGRPRFGRAQHRRLIEFDGPFAHLMPPGEGRRRLERVLTVADEEVAQAEFAWIVLHRHAGIGLRLYYSILFQLHKGDTWRSHVPWFKLTSRMKGDTAIALMTIRLS